MARKVAIIDYGMGNLMSVFKAWQRVGGDAKIISSRSDAFFKGADILVFPGQGAISDTMKLLEKTGFGEAIVDWIKADKPFFGICLGLQALFETSEEGNCACLGIFSGSVKKMRPQNGFKVPHMGWNNVEFNFSKKPEILRGINSEKDQFYFVHSYCVTGAQSDIILGNTEYGGINFTSAIARSNLVATQFHPEKSQDKGLLLYKNFLENL